MVSEFQLAERAKRLQEAFVFLVALLGLKAFGGDKSILTMPRWSTLGKGELRTLIRDLQSKILWVRRKWFPQFETPNFDEFCTRLSDAYRMWNQSGKVIWEFGRVADVELKLGLLPHRKNVECPPYAQVVIQNFEGAAIRHPEYHLARDLALHFNLLLDAEEINARLRGRGVVQCSEVNQSLARGVVLVCYNLLEAFTSGLVVASRHERPEIVEASRHRLDKPDQKRNALRYRFEDVPNLIAGKPHAMNQYQKLVLGPLFNDHKWRRDAFVHCEPGPDPSRYGHVKEDLFHDVELSVIRETMELTLKAIRAAWTVVYDRTEPRWLPVPDEKGRFKDISVRLTLEHQ